MRRFLAFFGFVGCGSSAVIHLVTFFGADPMMSWPALWILHVLAILAALSAIFSGSVVRSSRFNRSTISEIFDPWDLGEARAELSNMSQGSEVERAHAEAIVVQRFRPRPLAVALVCLFFYALLNFTITISLLGGASPTQNGDRYQLTSHGTVVKELTFSEYRWHRAYQTRLATGHWMLFFLMAGVLWRAPRRTSIGSGFLTGSLQ